MRTTCTAVLVLFACGADPAGTSEDSSSSETDSGEETTGTETSETTEGETGESGSVVGDCLGCDCDEECVSPWTCVAGACADPGYAWIPDGLAPIGCAPGDSFCEDDERPLHDAQIAGFQIGLTEVSAAEYADCVADGVCDVPSKVNVDIDDFYTHGAPGKEEHPINGVTWQQASSYCEWVGDRLPTEAEWEYAARGVEPVLYPWGDEPEPSCDVALVSPCPGLGTEAVGSHPDGASVFGVLGMGGNVSEFVADWYDPDYYSDSPVEDPQGPEMGDERVYRGGAFYGPLFLARASARSPVAPGFSSDGIGFRCARP